MLVDFENTGFIIVHPSLCEEKNTYIPWGYIKGDIAKQSDLMELLANIEGGLTAEQISLLVNVDGRFTEVERDIAALETSHELDITHINTEISKKANIVDVYTKSEIDSKNYLTEHQSLTGYATESWVYSKGYISTETDPIWNAEKHKYALKSEIPSTAGFATTNWVNEQLTEKANVSDIYSKIEIDSKKYITESQLNTELLAKANLSDIYTKIEIDGKNYAPKDWVATELLAYAKVGEVYTKNEIKDNLKLEGFITVDDLDGYATEDWVASQGYLTEHQSLDNYYTKEEVDTAIENVEVDLSDYYTKSEVDSAIENVEVDLSGYATESWVSEQGYLTEHQSLDNYYTKEEIDNVIENVEVDLSDYYTKSETESYVNTAVESKVDYSDIWTGTQEDWDALSAEQQNSYTIAMIEI